MGFLRQLANTFLDTVLPIYCLSCKAEKEWLCTPCRARIAIELEDVCFVCKISSSGGRTCFSCRRICSLGGVIRFLNYDDEMVQLLLRIAKYGYVRDALLPLLEVTTPYILPKLELLNVDLRATVLVPVPLHPLRRRDRGFNQAELIAQRFSAVVGAPVSPALIRRYHRPPQVSLDELDRARNIQGNIKCSDRQSIRDRWVYVVDDVATTGSTLDACGRVLRNAGAAEVWGIVLAKG